MNKGLIFVIVIATIVIPNFVKANQDHEISIAPVDISNESQDELSNNDNEINGIKISNEANKENGMYEGSNSLYNHIINDVSVSDNSPKIVNIPQRKYLTKEGSSENFQSIYLLVLLLFGMFM